MGVDIVVKLIIAMYGMIKELAGEDVFNEAMKKIQSPTVSKEDFESIAPDDEFSKPTPG